MEVLEVPKLPNWDTPHDSAAEAGLQLRLRLRIELFLPLAGYRADRLPTDLHSCDGFELLGCFWAAVCERLRDCSCNGGAVG